MSEASLSLRVYLSQSSLFWLTVTLLTYAATDTVWRFWSRLRSPS